MFGWFKKKKKQNIESTQKQAPTIVIQQAPAKPISKITQEKKAESDRLYQERQRVQSEFDPYAVDYTGYEDCKLSSVEKQFLKKIAGQPVDSPYVAGYWEYEYGLTFPVIMTKLLKNGYLKIGSAAENLDFLTVSELKDILKQHGLTISGKKAELIARINANVPKDILTSKLGEHKAHYILSEKGISISSNSPASITKDIDLEDACLIAIHQNDFNSAYKMIARREMGKRFPRGIGVNWEKESRDGLSAQQHDFYSRIISDTAGIERTYRECIILSDMLGVSNSTPLIKRVCGDLDESLLNDANYSLKKSKSQMDMESYISTGVRCYEVLGTKDGQSCPKCRKMNGKTFPITDAQIGKTFPPFCLKCRCTTVPYSED